MAKRYFEDIEVGRTRYLGSYQFVREEIVDFARRFDPMAIHLDPTVADSVHGGLIASGYHTLCIANRMVVDEIRQDIAGIAGLGIESLQWPTPVRPGQKIQYHHEVVDKRPSDSVSDAGIVSESITADNQRGDLVLSFDTSGLIKRRTSTD